VTSKTVSPSTTWKQANSHRLDIQKVMRSLTNNEVLGSIPKLVKLNAKLQFLLPCSSKVITDFVAN